MRLTKRISMSVIMVFCGIFLITGCGPQQPSEPAAIEQAIKQPEGVELSLKYELNDVGTYKVVTEQEKSIKFEGTPSEGVGFENARNYQKVEIIFEKKIDAVADLGTSVGSARVEITIKGLRYQKIHKNQQLMDYDSSREDQKDYPFSRLIGQKYTVWLSPAGKVVRVGNFSKAKAAVAGRSSAHQMALSLINKDEIKRRHSIKGLPGNVKTPLHIGQQWSETEDVSFDLMGSKSYEKIYTLEKISESEGRRTVVIETSTIPTAENAEQDYGKKEESGLTTMFDSSDSFSGETVVDLASGRVEKCTERLEAQWTVINPSGEEAKEPSALIMTNVRFYSLERIK